MLLTVESTSHTAASCTILLYSLQHSRHCILSCSFCVSARYEEFVARLFIETAATSDMALFDAHFSLSRNDHISTLIPVSTKSDET